MLTYQQTFDTVADLGGFTNETFGGSTKNARIIRRGIALAMKQIQALNVSGLQYKKSVTIPSVDAQRYYTLPSDFVTIASMVAIYSTHRIPMTEVSETEWRRLIEHPTKSSYPEAYIAKIVSGVSKVGINPTAPVGINFEVEYMASHVNLDYGVGSTDGNVVLGLDEGFEMLPVYFTISHIMKAREDTSLGTSWNDDYEKLLEKYKESSLTLSESPIVKRRSKRGNPTASLFFVNP